MEDNMMSVRTLGYFPLYQFFSEGATQLQVLRDDPQGRLDLLIGLHGFIRETAQKEINGERNATAVDLAILELDEEERTGVIVYADGRRIKVRALFGFPTFSIFCEAMGEADFIRGAPSVIYLVCPLFRPVNLEDPASAFYFGIYEYTDTVGLRKLGTVPFSGDDADPVSLTEKVREYLAAKRWGEFEIVDPTMSSESPMGVLIFPSKKRAGVKFFGWEQGGRTWLFCVERKSDETGEFSIFFLGARVRAPLPEMLCRS